MVVAVDTEAGEGARCGGLWGFAGARHTAPPKRPPSRCRHCLNPRRPRPRSILTVERRNGRRTVVVTDEELRRGVLSGHRVRVSGTWLAHPGRGDGPPDAEGPDEAVNLRSEECAKASECFKANAISNSGGKAKGLQDTTSERGRWQACTLCLLCGGQPAACCAA